MEAGVLIIRQKNFQIGPVIAEILKVTTRWQMQVEKIFNFGFYDFY